MTLLPPVMLAPLSALYSAVTRTRLALYRRGVLKTSQLAAPVISVGNITAGGTGKTPLVEYLARAVHQDGRRVCVLTRGYGREKAGRVMVSDGECMLASEREAGDEPRLLAERLRGVAAVISDANRFAAGQWAMKELGSEVFVLDDGFQHLNLQRDLNIVTIDATRPWGDRRLLPWGRLREPTRGLSRADCVVITRADQSDGVQALQEEIKALVPNGQVFTSQMYTCGFKQVGVSFSEDHGGLTGEIAQPVGTFCAVGNPAAFIQQLRDAGYDPVSTTVFPDHHRFSEYEIASIVRKAKAAGATSLITTAKDAVKLREFSFELPCYVLEIEIRIDDESRFLAMIRAKIAVR